MEFQNIILFGAGGTTIGSHILKALLRDNTFNVAILARQSSKTTYPPSVKISKVPDPFPHNELIEALRGQDVVISATGFHAQEEQYRVIDAAIEAGVKRFIPSEWGMDNDDPMNRDLCPVFKNKGEVADYLRSRESRTFSWTAVATGIWLDWALDTKFLGIDPVGHTTQLWEDGTHEMSHTTLEYAAQAVIEMLKRPEIGVNQHVFLSPFQASQRQIVGELERQQRAEYTSAAVDGAAIIGKAKRKWLEEQDDTAAYTLVSAGILLPEYSSDFRTAVKQPILEELVDMRKFTLNDVVREWVMFNKKA